MERYWSALGISQEEKMTDWGKRSSCFPKGLEISFLLTSAAENTIPFTREGISSCYISINIIMSIRDHGN